MLPVYRCVLITLLALDMLSYQRAVGGQAYANKIFKKIKVPKGSSLSLTVQVSRPKILTNFIENHDAIILDGVVEVPMWLDIDRFVTAMYDDTAVGPVGPRSNNDEPEFEFRGKERCLLFSQLESFLATLLLLPVRTTHACLLRAICEVHEIATFYFPSHSPSFAFELIHLFLSPSLGSKDDCHKEYRIAEDKGKSGLCYTFNTNCPINITALIFSRLIPRQQ